MPHNFSIELLPLLPAWLIAGLATALLVLLILGSGSLLRKRVPARWVMGLGMLRTAIILAFVLCLLGPVLSFQKQITRKPDLLLLVDTSRSMAQPAPGQGDISRLALGLSQLQSSGLLRDLEKHYNLRPYAFDRGAHAITAADLPTLMPTGQSTQLNASLRDAWQAVLFEQSGNTSAGPARVLLVTDGISTHANASTTPWTGSELPIDFLDLGSSAQAADASPVRITSVQSQPRVLLGSDAAFIVTLGRADDLARSITLVLMENDEPVATQEVHFDTSQVERTARMDYRPQQAGVHRYRLAVLPAGASTADRAVLSEILSQNPNQSYEQSLRVEDGRTNLLYLEDTHRWSFRFIKRLVEDDPSYRLTAMLARGGGAYNRFGDPAAVSLLSGFPQSINDLAAMDILLLGDVNPQRWPAGLARAIRHAVAEQGKSLVVVAGPNLDRWLSSPELLTLLPVEISPDTTQPLEGPIDVTITPQGRASSFFADNQAIFSQPLPPVDFIYAPLRKKAGATILLTAPAAATQAGEVIVMAEHTVGRGRVLWIGTDTLWKWQLTAVPNEAGATPYSLFWQQALRSLTPAQPGNQLLTLHAQRSQVAMHERVNLVARVNRPRLPEEAMMQATITLPDGSTTPLPFLPSPSDPTTFAAELHPATAGAYRINASLLSQGKVISESTTTLDVAPALNEDAPLPIAREKLLNLAQATQGRAVLAADPATWPKPTNESTRTITQASQLDLWHHYVLMIVLCILLGVDWLIRLLRGYV